MSKKGTTIQAPAPQMDREQSPDELRLLQTQNNALASGIAISEEQEARSRQLHDIWKETYLPVETGMIHGDASEANGYMDSASIAHAMDSKNYQPKAAPSGGSGIAEDGSPKDENLTGLQKFLKNNKETMHDAPEGSKGSLDWSTYKSNSENETLGEFANRNNGRGA